MCFLLLILCYYSALISLQVDAWTRICVSIRRLHRYSTTSIKRRSSASFASVVPICIEKPFIFNGTVSILDLGAHHVVVSKPSAVICHRSDWSDSMKGKASLNRENDYTSTNASEVPMLQRVREAVGERVNLIHRLDRGASGCLLFSFAKSDQATAMLQECMTHSPTTQKTYLAVVRGEGVLKGRDFRREGWFKVDRPIKDKVGNFKNATSYFRFIAGQDNGNGTIDRPRASLVLARPVTGRYHQIRKHLNGLSHPIIGDSTHGNSRINREWQEKWDLKQERTCLHLLKLELPPTSLTPNGIYVVDSLAPDMLNMLQCWMPEILKDSEKVLNEEGLSLISELEPSIVPISLELS